jgi:hypothetical protein
VLALNNATCHKHVLHVARCKILGQNTAGCWEAAKALRPDHGSAQLSPKRSLAIDTALGSIADAPQNTMLPWLQYILRLQ